jgi:hypothetical protein
MADRLRKGDTSLYDMLLVSARYYLEKDDKKWRAEVDVVSAKITARKNLSYNPRTHKWEQIGREVKFQFLIKTDPISYKKNDSLKFHYYPVIFLLRDFDKGIASPFRSRVGGLKRWKKSRRKISEGKTPDEKDRIRRENKKIQELNIKNQLSGDFIFRQMWVWKQYDLLFGPMTCLNKPPDITNPDKVPYFSKHEFFILQNLLIPILNKKSGIIRNKLFKNELRK